MINEKLSCPSLVFFWIFISPSFYYILSLLLYFILLYFSYKTVLISTTNSTFFFLNSSPHPTGQWEEQASGCMVLSCCPTIQDTVGRCSYAECFPQGQVTKLSLKMYRRLLGFHLHHSMASVFTGLNVSGLVSHLQ